MADELDVLLEKVVDPALSQDDRQQDRRPREHDGQGSNWLTALVRPAPHALLPDLLPDG